MTAPPGPPPAPPGVPPGAAPEPPRRLSAFSEGLARLRAGARTEPGRLRIIGAAVAGLLLLLGAVTTWQVTTRAAAADTIVDSSQPLSADAASIYRSLADANTTAAAGFLDGADEEPGVRERYERDITRAARLLAEAAARSEGTGRSQELIERLNRALPRYTGLVETARANNRQGLPLGGAYLRYADERMQELLPLAEELYALETERLRRDIDDARSWPWPALVLGLAALAVLTWAQRRNYRRTNRVFNAGLLLASAVAAALLLWLSASQFLTRSHLQEADSEAAQSLRVLNDAWTEALKARGDENMTLVARGAGTAFEEDYQRHMAAVAGAAEAGDGDGDGGDGDGDGDSRGLLARAEALAEDEEGRAPVRDAIEATAEWRERHAASRARENSGDYDAAVAAVIGGSGSTAETFDQVNSSLGQAVAHEQREFDAAAASGRGALGGLANWAMALAVLGALAAVLGIGRRLSEYR